VVIGGIIPDVDIPQADGDGFKGIFLPGPDAAHHRLHQCQCGQNEVEVRS
jgi:methylmalonyl-CoA mutase cobalamin-binding subunit